MTTMLKGGFETSDPRLDRIPQFDARSRSFAASSGLSAKKPRSYTWSCSEHLDQGFEGACTGFAFGHDAIARPVMVKNIVDAQYCREKIYWQAQRVDPWEGGAYPGADPFYEGSSILAAAKTSQSLGHFDRYEWSYSLDELILAVGYKGPAILGINWYSGMYDPDESGFLHADGYIAGGHAILCNKVNLKGEYFGVHNSWGSGWGVGGTAKISFEDMARLLAEDGEACTPVLRRKVSI